MELQEYVKLIYQKLDELKPILNNPDEMKNTLERIAAAERTQQLQEAAAKSAQGMAQMSEAAQETSTNEFGQKTTRGGGYFGESEIITVEQEFEF